jgi:hypothetical protein
MSATAVRTTRRSSLPRCKRGGSASARTAVHECHGCADDAEVIPPADHADDAEVIPPADHADDAEVVPPADHADDAEVIPPALQPGRVRLRADRSA